MSVKMWNWCKVASGTALTKYLLAPFMTLFSQCHYHAAFTMLQYNSKQYNTIQYSTVQYSTVQVQVQLQVQVQYSTVRG